MVLSNAGKQPLFFKKVSTTCKSSSGALTHLKLHKKAFFAVLLIIILSFAAGAMYVKAQSGSTLPAQTLSAGPVPGAPNYTIFTDGQGNYYAKDKNGAIDYGSTSAATVIQDALNAMPNGGEIYITSGIYPISTQITVTENDITIEGANSEATILEATSSMGNAQAIICAQQVYNLKLSNFGVNIAALSNTYNYGIWLNGVADSMLEDIWLTGNYNGGSMIAGQYGIYIDNTLVETPAGISIIQPMMDNFGIGIYETGTNYSYRELSTLIQGLIATSEIIGIQVDYAEALQIISPHIEIYANSASFEGISLGLGTGGGAIDVRQVFVSSPEILCNAGSSPYGLASRQDVADAIFEVNSGIQGQISIQENTVYPSSVWISGLPQGQYPVTAGTSPFTFPLSPYNQIYIITSVGGMTSLELDGNVLFNSVYSVGQMIYVPANIALYVIWSTTAPTFKVIPEPD